MSKKKLALSISAGTAGTSGLVALLIYGLTPQQINAKISQTHWTYTVNLHARTLAHDEDWDQPGPVVTPWGLGEQPFNVSCERRVRSHRNCNCYKTCTGTGNQKHCIEHCSRCPVYDDWCSYSYYAWPVVATRVTEGTSNEGTFFSSELEAKDASHHIMHYEKYSVSFSGPEKVWTYVPPNKKDFDRFFLDDTWEIEYARFGDTAKPLTLIERTLSSEKSAWNKIKKSQVEDAQ